MFLQTGGKKRSPARKKRLKKLMIIDILHPNLNYILRKLKDIKEGSWTDGGKTRIDSPGFLLLQ
jgi:hypothetical protein